MSAIPEHWVVTQFEIYRPKLPATEPMIRPPRAPVPRIGAATFVMIASGRLKRMPMNSPITQLGQGRRRLQTTNPIANRAMKAPSIAPRLSGKVIGIMIATSMLPKIKPQSTPSHILTWLIPQAVFLAGSASERPVISSTARTWSETAAGPTRLTGSGIMAGVEGR